MHLDSHHRLDRRTSRAFCRRALLQTEPLEPRQLLSATTVDLSGLTAVPAITSAATGLPGGGLTPSELASAYNFPSASGTPLGTGQTIAIVDAYNDPNIQTDLANFSQQFGLATPQLTVVNELGSSTSLPAADAGWSQEIALDVEWAHAAAPGARILLVEASSANLNDLVTGIQYAAQHANVVSISWGGSEFYGETQLDSLFNVPGVTFVAAAGDTPGTSWPAVSPAVVGVGGTTLSLANSGTSYGSESVWNSTGGGISYLESAPSYQAGYSGLLGVGVRVSPDVGYNANPASGVDVLDTYQNTDSSNGWFQVGGTSAGAPQWAGIFADANALRKSSASSTTVLNDLYGLASNPGLAASDFHKVTAGDSYFLNTSTGATFSLGTGLGTPNVANLIASLSGTSATTTTTTGAATTTTTGGTGNAGAGNTGTTGAAGATGTGSTGGGGYGYGRHHRYSDPAATVQISLSPAPTAPAASLGAVVSVAPAAVAPSQTVSVTSPSAAAAQVLARPVQPVAAPAPGLLGIAADAEAAERQAVGGAAAVRDEAPDAVAPPAGVPNHHDAAPVEDAPRPGNDAAPTADAPAAVDTTFVPETWDDALSTLADAPALAPVAIEPAANPVGDAGVDRFESALALGAAAAVWGSWEARSRLNDRRARRSVLKRAPR